VPFLVLHLTVAFCGHAAQRRRATEPRRRAVRTEEQLVGLFGAARRFLAFPEVREAFVQRLESAFYPHADFRPPFDLAMPDVVRRVDSFRPRHSGAMYAA